MAGGFAGCELVSDLRLGEIESTHGNHRRRAKVVEMTGGARRRAEEDCSDEGSMLPRMSPVVGHFSDLSGQAHHVRSRG
jgi:hypothetical protein